MKIAIVDTAIANLGSVSRALGELGAEPVIARTPEILESADSILLPGVGSFARGMEKLRESGFAGEIRRQVERGKAVLGICLGMQLLADEGAEGGENAGLGLIGGRIVHLKALGCDERLPHMGWNDIRIVRPCEITGNIGDGADFYFVHSYAFIPDDETAVVAECAHGVNFPAIVRSGNVFGAQFHPEKSSEAGFRILRNFIDYRPC